ncbi:MAG: nucleoside deaminase [Desulfobacteraceae bacterium]|jgi:tRNA(Arg) A34 adenosine deaminase TadA|nr:MAG: nucleoside deaminase [Desulfobacteraceae bacterium]
MNLPAFTFRLPAWVDVFLNHQPAVYSTIEDRMRLVVDLARKNIANESGGPFGAAVFDASGTLITPGVNLVITANCSVLHAEITAMVMAQKILGRYDISDGGRMNFELVSSSEPCAMCFGAIPWSGVRRLVCGARAEDAEAVGFDEGPKPADWVRALTDRGIEVTRDVLRSEAVSVLKDYAAGGGLIYNAGQPLVP